MKIESNIPPLYEDRVSFEEFAERNGLTLLIQRDEPHAGFYAVFKELHAEKDWHHVRVDDPRVAVSEFCFSLSGRRMLKSGSHNALYWVDVPSLRFDPSDYLVAYCRALEKGESLPPEPEHVVKVDIQTMLAVEDYKPVSCSTAKAVDDVICPEIQAGDWVEGLSAYQSLGVNLGNRYKVHGRTVDRLMLDDLPATYDPRRFRKVNSIDSPQPVTLDELIDYYRADGRHGNAVAVATANLLVILRDRIQEGRNER